MDRFRIGELAGFCGEGLGVTLANFELPICNGDG